MRQCLAGTAVLLFLFSPQLLAKEFPWQPKKNEDGIRVEVRKVESSPYLEYRGMMVLDVPLEQVIALYEDAPRMTEWFHQCIASEELEKKSPEDRILYFAIDLPWPVQDRDVVYRRVRHQDPQTGTIEYQASALGNIYKEQPDRLRMPEIKGLWRFTPLGGGRTGVYHQQHGDAGGFIPPWLVNQLAVNIPFNSLSNFRKLLTEENPA